mmetsp:Transcript_7026/g.13847  ORF Transcript_7026/g.13847 Transcript_7026/m.13847 type:complete len:308 (-) Transcript_7026:3932-4855(-)
MIGWRELLTLVVLDRFWFSRVGYNGRVSLIEVSASTKNRTGKVESMNETICRRTCVGSRSVSQSLATKLSHCLHVHSHPYPQQFIQLISQSVIPSLIINPNSKSKDFVAIVVCIDSLPQQFARLGFAAHLFQSLVLSSTRSIPSRDGLRNASVPVPTVPRCGESNLPILSSVRPDPSVPLSTCRPFPLRVLPLAAAGHPLVSIETFVPCPGLPGSGTRPCRDRVPCCRPSRSAASRRWPNSRPTSALVPPGRPIDAAVSRFLLATVPSLVLPFRGLGFGPIRPGPWWRPLDVSFRLPERPPTDPFEP